MRPHISLIALALSACFTVAQAQIVLPPAPLAPAGQQTAPAAKPAAQVSAKAPTPPPATPAPTPRADVQPPATMDVLLPAAPKPPEGEPLLPMKPAASTGAKKSAPIPKMKLPDAATTKASIPSDPFAGIVGYPVSDSQLNRFVFPEAVDGVFFPEGAPLPECPKDVRPEDPCKPVFLNGRRMILLQLRAGAQGPVQMLVSLRSGRVISLNLSPARGPGAIVRIDGAEDGPSDARIAETRGRPAGAGGLQASEQDVAFLARFARGDIPGGFDALRPEPPRRYDLFDTVPMATWSNGSTQLVRLVQVRAFTEQPVVISPGLFRGANVRAVALDRETITESQPAMLYLLEQIPQ